MAKTRVAVVTKGHPFEAEPFFAVFDSFETIEWTHIEHPEAIELVQLERSAAFDVFVMYDMPGIAFTRSDPPVEFTDPPGGYVEAFAALLDRGPGMVFLHHAIASWPTWPGYADIVGGRFHYQPGSLDGVDWPDSGYRHDVTHTVEIVAPDHPICRGLDATFEITDELYLFPVFEAAVQPLMRSRHRFTDDGFYSADLAIRGTRYSNDGWAHPPGSDLVAWVRPHETARIAYIQFGDGPATYADPNYRRVLANAIDWAGSVGDAPTGD